jgi:predicted Zn-dependent peptidase
MKITEFVFENGLRVIYQKRPDPITAVSLFCNVGSVNEPLDLNGNINLNGISHMIEHMMFKGTTNIEDTKGIARKFDEIGAYFNAYTDKNVTCYTVKSSNIHIDIIIKTLADMLMNSLFLEKEFEMEKNVVTEEIIRAIDNTANHINNEIYTLYFKGNNLANPIGGYPEDIKNYDYAESKKYFQTFYTPSNMVLSICTDLPFSKIKSIISQSYLITSPSKSFKNTIYTNLKPIEIQKGIRSKAIDRKLEQTHIAVGFRTTDMYDDDKYLIDIVRIILAGNMSSRLFTNLREKRGLTYTIHIDASEYENYGHFTILTSVDKNKLLEYTENGNKLPGALHVIKDNLQELIDNGITAQELDKAKGYIEGKLILSTEDALHVSDYNGKIIVFDHPHFIPLQDLYKIKYSLITRKAVNDTIRKYFKKDRLSLYLIGENATKDLKKGEEIFNTLNNIQ